MNQMAMAAMSILLATGLLAVFGLAYGFGMRCADRAVAWIERTKLR